MNFELVVKNPKTRDLDPDILFISFDFLVSDPEICFRLRYETLRSTLERFPLTLLGNAERRKQFYIKSKDCYFFDRNHQCFISILCYYQTSGVLLRPPDIPMSMFIAEVEFFDLGKNVVAGLREKEGFPPKVVDLPKNPLQRRIWLLFEEPDSSMSARFLAMWSISVIAISIILFCMETMPIFKEHMHGKHHDPRPHVTTGTTGNNTTTWSKPRGGRMSYAQPWFSLELACIVWFTFEYVTRFLSAPSKWRFFWSFLNIIDLLAILPYFFILALSNGHMTPILRVVRLVRVFRVFKLSRHSLGLQILGHTLRASINELGMLIFFLCIAVVLFSSAIYYAEQGHNDQFVSIPDGFWYAVVTMTTVGYGDKAPITVLGKLIGSLCAVSGVLTIALPVPVIVSNFEFFYKRDRQEQEDEKMTAAAGSMCDVSNDKLLTN